MAQGPPAVDEGLLGELTLITPTDILGREEGSMGGLEVSGGGGGDHELVEAVLRDLAEAADRWEALLAEAATITYSVDMGDIHAVADCDGRLVDLTLHPSVPVHYSHHELAERLNIAFDALRAEAQEDYQARYGGTLQ